MKCWIHEQIHTEVEVQTIAGAVGSAIVPSGASTGKREALELRDQDLKRYNGKGVLKAIENVNTKINSILSGVDVLDQKKCDRLMIDYDGTDNKSSLGANAILGVSMAIAQAAAVTQNIPLFKYLNQIYEGTVDPVMPVPMMNILNGGAHANNSLDIQEFMVIPHATDSFQNHCGWELKFFMR